MNHAPLKIAGEGSLELEPDRLIARGFAPKGAALAAIAMFVVCAAASLGAAYLILRAMGMGMSPAAIGGGIGGGFIGAAAMPRKSTKTPVEMSLPWAAVKQVLQEGKSVVVIAKGEGVKGSLHFHPERQDAATVVAAVQQQLARAQKAA